MLDRSVFSFKKKLQMWSLLSSMTSSPCFLPPKVGVERKLMSKKILSPKIFDQATAFMLTAYCLALPDAKSSHGLKLPMMWIPMTLVLAHVIDSDGWLRSTWK